MKRPTESQFEIATLWLETNEGEGDERRACEAVARWIRDQMTDRMLKAEARHAGVRVADLRRKLKEART